MISKTSNRILTQTTKHSNNFDVFIHELYKENGSVFIIYFQLMPILIWV